MNSRALIVLVVALACSASGASLRANDLQPVPMDVFFQPYPTPDQPTVAIACGSAAGPLVTVTYDPTDLRNYQLIITAKLVSNGALGPVKTVPCGGGVCGLAMVGAPGGIVTVNFPGLTAGVNYVFFAHTIDAQLKGKSANSPDSDPHIYGQAAAPINYNNIWYPQNSNQMGVTWLGTPCKPVVIGTVVPYYKVYCYRRIPAQYYGTIVRQVNVPEGTSMASMGYYITWIWPRGYVNQNECRITYFNAAGIESPPVLVGI